MTRTFTRAAAMTVISVAAACLLGVTSAASESGAYVVSSVELPAAPTSEVLVDQVWLHNLSDGSRQISGSLELPEEGASGFMITVSVDPEAETYSAELELLDDSWFQDQDPSGSSNLVPDPEEGCPVQICHREARVGGRRTDTPAGELENVTRADIDYAFYPDTLAVDLLGHLQKCVNHPQWYLLACNKPAPTDGVNTAEVRTEGNYRLQNQALWMNTVSGIQVANGVQLLIFQYSDLGWEEWNYEGVIIVNAWSCYWVFQ